MYSYPITPEEMRIIFEGFCEVAVKYPTSREIALKYADYFGYDYSDNEMED